MCVLYKLYIIVLHCCIHWRKMFRLFFLLLIWAFWKFISCCCHDPITGTQAPMQEQQLVILMISLWRCDGGRDAATGEGGWWGWRCCVWSSCHLVILSSRHWIMDGGMWWEGRRGGGDVFMITLMKLRYPNIHNGATTCDNQTHMTTTDALYTRGNKESNTYHIKQANLDYFYIL